MGLVMHFHVRYFQRPCLPAAICLCQG